MMKRSSNRYPLAGIDLSGGLQVAWEKGWLDEFSDNHFLIQAIERRLGKLPASYYFDEITRDLSAFQVNFCINISFKISKLISLFGEHNIRRFFTDQLSAGKDNYDQDQFFRALSEISVLCFYAMNADAGEYEPKINGKKNPEARLSLKNGVTVDIEVKTPGFNDFRGIDNIVIPTVLLDDQGRQKFSEYCIAHNLKAAMPRVMKIKDFLNSAAEKFEEVDHENHMNLLYINWSLSEFEESGYQEAFSLMAHPVNGLLFHRDIGMSLGVDGDVYEKITAVIVYTESLYGLMFTDFRNVWMRGRDGQPNFGIIGMHNCSGISEVTRMNPNANQATPVVTGIFRDSNCVSEIMSLIGRHMLRP